jgi:hypothetical protein
MARRPSRSRSALNRSLPYRLQSGAGVARAAPASPFSCPGRLILGLAARAMIGPPRLTRGCSRRARPCKPWAADAAAPVAPATPGKNDRERDGFSLRRARKPALQWRSADAAPSPFSSQASAPRSPQPAQIPSAASASGTLGRPRRRAALMRYWPASFSHSSSLSTFTPSSRALPSLEPASLPATT